MSTAEGEETTVRTLINALRELQEAVDDAAKRTADTEDVLGVQAILLAELKKSTAKYRRLLKWVWVTIIADIVVTLLVGALGYVIHVQNNKLDAVQARTSSQVLCPLYSLLERETKVKPQPDQVNTPAKLKAYRDSVRVIHQGYKVLGCED